MAGLLKRAFRALNHRRQVRQRLDQIRSERSASRADAFNVIRQQPGS